jgi:hypothetical protein
LQTLAAITVDVAFIAVVFVAFFFVRPELPKKKRASEDDLTSTWGETLDKEKIQTLFKRSSCRTGVGCLQP